MNKNFLGSKFLKNAYLDLIYSIKIYSNDFISIKFIKLKKYRNLIFSINSLINSINFYLKFLEKKFL